MTKPIIVVRAPCKLLYVIQVKEFLIKCLTSWPYLISEFLVAYITIVASDWPRTFFTPKVFLFSIIYYKKESWAQQKMVFARFRRWLEPSISRENLIRLEEKTHNFDSSQYYKCKNK